MASPLPLSIHHFHFRLFLSIRPEFSSECILWNKLVYKKIYNFAPDIEDIVGTDQHLPQTAGAVVVDVLICVGQMEVHVLVGGHEVALEGEKNC